MLCLINVSRRADLKRYSNEERARFARMRARIKAAESTNKTVDCDAFRAKVTLRRSVFHLLAQKQCRCDDVRFMVFPRSF